MFVSTTTYVLYHDNGGSVNSVGKNVTIGTSSFAAVPKYNVTFFLSVLLVLGSL